MPLLPNANVPSLLSGWRWSDMVKQAIRLGGWRWNQSEEHCMSLSVPKLLGGWQWAVGPTTGPGRVPSSPYPPGGVGGQAPGQPVQPLPIAHFNDPGYPLPPKGGYPKPPPGVGGGPITIPQIPDYDIQDIDIDPDTLSHFFIAQFAGVPGTSPGGPSGTAPVNKDIAKLIKIKPNPPYYRPGPPVGPPPGGGGPVPIPDIPDIQDVIHDIDVDDPNLGIYIGKLLGGWQWGATEDPIQSLTDYIDFAKYPIPTANVGPPNYPKLPSGPPTGPGPQPPRPTPGTPPGGGLPGLPGLQDLLDGIDWTGDVEVDPDELSYMPGIYFPNPGDAQLMALQLLGGWQWGMHLEG